MWRWEWSGIAFREKHCCSIQLPHHPTPPKKESEFPGWDIHKTCCNHIIKSSACPGMFSEDEAAKSNYNHLVGDFWQWLRQHTELDWTVSSRWQRKHSVHLPCQKTSHRLCRPSSDPSDQDESIWNLWRFGAVPKGFVKLYTVGKNINQNPVSFSLTSAQSQAKDDNDPTGSRSAVPL